MCRSSFDITVYWVGSTGRNLLGGICCALHYVAGETEARARLPDPDKDYKAEGW